MLAFLRLAHVPDPKRGAQTAEPIRVILADDHAAVRRSLRVLLDGESDLNVVAETDSLRSVMQHVHATRPDVLVLDVGSPESTTATEALSRLHREAPDTRIVLLVSNDDPVFAQRALDNGAAGLVLKDMADADLPAAVRETSRGRRYLSLSLQAKLQSAEATVQDRLTPREREVLRLIALGHTSVEIAEKLGLSPRTIETHRARIHRKLGLGTRAELVRYALRHNLLRI